MRKSVTKKEEHARIEMMTVIESNTVAWTVQEARPNILVGSVLPLPHDAWPDIFDLSDDKFHRVDRNPLLVEDIPCTVEAEDLANQYGFEPCFIPMFQIAINGGLATDEWQNVIEHQVSVARLARTYSRLIGLSRADEARVTAAALVHDADMRREKDELNRIKISRTILGGTNGDVAYQEAFFQAEMEKRVPWGVAGLSRLDPSVLCLTRVTHLDWRDCGNWLILENILRLGDSSVRGKEYVPPWVRIANLIENKPEMNERGKEYYEGTPAFERLGEITQAIARDLEDRARLTHPDYLLSVGYPHQSLRMIAERIARGEIPPPERC